MCGRKLQGLLKLRGDRIIFRLGARLCRHIRFFQLIILSACFRVTHGIDGTRLSWRGISHVGFEALIENTVLLGRDTYARSKRRRWMFPLIRKVVACSLSFS